MKKFLVVCFSVTLLAFICSVTQPVQAAQTKLTYSVFFPPTHGQAKAADSWAKEIEKRTHGKVKITILAGGTLTPADQTYDGVAKGIADIGMSCFALHSGKVSRHGDSRPAARLVQRKVATRVANDFYERFRPKELEGVKVLYIHAHGPGLLHTVRPVRSLADIKGMKIRSTGLSSKVVSALGAVPVAMPQGETYESLQKGVVEGTITPIETLKGWKQAEVIKYTTDCKSIGYTTAMFVVMNLRKWNSLPRMSKRCSKKSAKSGSTFTGRNGTGSMPKGRNTA